jgi:uncharacterized protein YqfB (UPF0267 family)
MNWAASLIFHQLQTPDILAGKKTITTQNIGLERA